MKKNIGIFNLLLIFITFIALDYITKLWAIKNLFIEAQSIQLTPFLSMTPVWNSGISFGFFQLNGSYLKSNSTRAKTKKEREIMVKRIVILTFLLIQPLKAECKYYAEADVVNDKIVNKKEIYKCKENENFLIKFMTDEKFHSAFVMTTMMIMENL